MVTTYRSQLVAGIASSVFWMVICGPVYAQNSASSAPAAQPTPSTSSTLQEVVVTARKTSESLTSVPLSVTALSSSDIVARDITNFEGLQDFSPGFKFINQDVNRNDRGYSSFIMRGMNPSTPVTYAQGVSIFVDGSPVAGGVVSGLNDVDQVEVLKGPQSAYFGRATFSGAVNFITNAPSFQPKAKVDIAYGSYNTSDMSGEVEGPLYGDILSGRLAVRSYHTDGQYADPIEPNVRLGEQDTKSVALNFLAKPTDKLSIRLSGTYWQDNDGPADTAYILPDQYNCAAGPASAVSGIQFVNGKNYVCGTLPKFEASSLAINTNVPSALIQALEGHIPALYNGVVQIPTLASYKGPNGFGLTREAYNIHSNIHYAFDNGYAVDAVVGHNSNVWGFVADITAGLDLSKTPNPLYGSISATNAPGLLPIGGFAAFGSVVDSDTSGEIRLTSPQSDRFRYMVGLSHFESSDATGVNLYLNFGFFQPGGVDTNTANTNAIFGSVNYDLLKNLTLTFEGREQWDTIADQATGAAKNQATFQSFNPRAIVSYHPTEQSTLYVSYAAGTKPGTFNGSLTNLPASVIAQIDAVAPVQIAVPEEHVYMAELGAKIRFLDNRAQILTAIYYGDWTGRHISDKVYYNNPNGDLVTALFNIAGGEVKLQGIEAEGKFQVNSNILLEGTFNYAGTNIRKDYCGDCLLINGNPTPVGTTVPGYPTYSGSLAGTYTRHAFGDYDGFMRLDYIYTGNIYVDDTNIVGTGASNKVNIHAGLNNGRIRLEAYATNITNDQHYLFGQRYSQGQIAAGSSIQPGNPVNEISVSPADKPTYGMRLIMKF